MQVAARSLQRADVIVVGGGITGLTAAHHLISAGRDLRVVLLEADEVLGGKIRTTSFAGRPLEEGPDGIVDDEATRSLISDLGITSTSLRAAGERPGIWSTRGIRPLPPGLINGIPVRPLEVMRSGLLSPFGLARAGLDLVLPSTQPTGDTSIAELVRRRFGREVVERLVAPLIGGICAGDVHRLSAAAVTPAMFSAAIRHRSLKLGLQRDSLRATSTSRGSVNFQGGLAALVDSLAAELDDGVARCSTPVLRISRRLDGWYVTTARNTLIGGHLLLATPAQVSARLVHEVDAEAAGSLENIPHVSVAVVTLAYAREALPAPPRTSGFLVPRQSGFLITAGTWLSVKWPREADPPTLLLRCSVGRDGDERWQTLDDDALVDEVRSELATLVGLRGTPLETRVRRWPDALPQYRVGHRETVARVRRALGPRLLLAGAAYDGIGVASCIAQGRAAANQILQQITKSTDTIVAESA